MTRITLVFTAVVFDILGIWFIWAAIVNKLEGYKNRVLLRFLAGAIGVVFIYQSVVLYLG